MANVKQFSEIVALLTPHFERGDQDWLCAEHDVIYFPCHKKDLDKSILDRLEALGAHWNDEADSWAAFV